MSIADLLRQAGVTHALVVDDAFDLTPTPDDLLIDEDDWAQLFDDLTGPDVARLGALYPRYREVRGDELRRDPAFIATLWEHRADFAPAVTRFFERYEADKASDARLLDPLLDFLRGVGLNCATSGRDFTNKADGVQLIFVDLYLKTAQREDDIRLSVEGVSAICARRKASPPLVVLMSRSNALPDKRKAFRDDAQLYESNFRILSKEDISNRLRLERTVTRLVTHYEDAKKLSAFVNAWGAGLDAARERTTALIRRLRLADLAQIYELLLSAEGEPMGSYLVDVFDKVLQHEIERDEAIIGSALELNALKGDSYPPPYVPDDPDLQDLIYRSLFQNRARLKLAGTVTGSVAFGDILHPAGRPAADAPSLADELHPDKVLAVLTPACDLQRGGAKRVLLLGGTLKPLARESWTYGDEGAKTPVIEMVDGTRFWVKWDLKHIFAWSQIELASLLGAGRLRIEARLRESHALELQQKLLSNLGRVGALAPMPATFEVRVEAFYPGMENQLCRLEVPALNDGGVCFVGRSKLDSKMEERLVLTEAACDSLSAAIIALDQNTINERARALLQEIRKTPEMLQTLERGVLLSSNRPGDWKDIRASDGRTFGYVRRVFIKDGEAGPDRQKLSNAGVLLSVVGIPAPQPAHEVGGDGGDVGTTAATPEQAGDLP